MVILVLYHTREVALDHLVVSHKILVEPFETNLLDAGYRLMNAGQTEAALLAGLLGPVIEHFELGVDKGEFLALTIGKILGHGAGIDDDEPYRQAYLRRCQPDAIGGIHRLIHVGNQLFELRVRSIDLFGLLTNDGVSVQVNR